MRFSEWMEIREAKDACYHKVKSRYKVWPSAYASGALVKCRKKGAKNWGNKKKKMTSESASRDENQEDFTEGTFDLEKKEGLRGWFARNGGKGWIDCKKSTKKKKVPCGRKKAGRGTDREYPACRPTLSACNSIGKKRKKDSNPISWKKD
jgi:hypothetical protein